MATPVLTKRLTREDVLLLPDGDAYELVDGQLQETHVSLESSLIGLELGAVIRNFVRPGRLGFVAGPDNALEIFDDRHHYRKADVSFTRRDRFPATPRGRGDQEIAPDLVAEVVSPNDRAEELETKIQEYLDAGVTLIWVFYPSNRSVVVIRRGRTRHRLGPDEMLDGEDILPGFSYPVADVFDI